MMKTALQIRATEVLETLVASGVDRGAQVAVYRDGVLVADAWAGKANPFTHERVTGETLFPVFSVTKGVASTVIHRLVERGMLSYATRIADAWPEYGRSGKAGTTLRHALEHTAGVPDLPPGLTFDEMLYWARACEALAKAMPAYPPGAQCTYHAKTFGWLIGEVARRVTGNSFGDLVRDEISVPLGLDSLHVGLPPDCDAPVAFVEESDLGPVPVPEYRELVLREAAKVPLTHQMNSREMRAACLPSTNAVANARAIAKHYAALLPGGVDGVELLPSHRRTNATKWKIRLDAQGREEARGLGYMRVQVIVDGRTYEGFGHGGYGGSMGCAFPDQGLAISYTRNRLNGPGGWGPLSQALFRTLSAPVE